MDSKVNDIIRRCAVDGRINYKKHALVRMVERRIKTSDVVEALIKPNFIKEYPNDTPLKSYLLLGYTGRNRPLHIVAAPDDDSDILWIITVYEPDKDKWNKDFTKRR